MERPLVFGIGLSRTGTTSLSAALGRLGWNVAHFPDDADTAQSLMFGEYRLKLFGAYNAICDTPAAAFFPQFAEEFPEARFILTTRPLDQWLESVARYWPTNDSVRLGSEFDKFIDSVVYGAVKFDQRRFLYAYERHHREVQRVLGESGRLLRVDICNGDGWDAICEFLEVPVPREPFPHAHSSVAQ